MDTHIQVNQYTLDEVKAVRHPDRQSLAWVTFTEQLAGSHRGTVDITADESVWQQVVDQLAAIGITPTIETTPVVPSLAPVPDGAR